LWVVIANHREWHFAPYIALVLLVGTGIACARISAREIWRRVWLIVVLFALGVAPMLPATDVDDRKLSTLGPLVTSYGVAHTTLLIAGIILMLLFFAPALPLPTLRTFYKRRRIKVLRVLIFFAALLAFTLLLLVSGPPPTQLLPLGPYIITYGGVWTLMTSLVVLLALLILSLLMTMTTSPIALIEGLTLLLAPLRRLKLPVDDFALMALLALRFIPTLLDETEQLIKAQTARGADLSSGTMLERLRNLSMLFVPLMQGALRRASDLATALEARGYEVDGKQTLLHETTFALADYLVMGLVVGVTIASLLV